MGFGGAMAAAEGFKLYEPDEGTERLLLMIR
jgi:hypothetical protein